MSEDNSVISPLATYQSVVYGNNALSLKEKKNISDQKRDYISVLTYKSETHCTAKIISPNLVYYRDFDSIVNLEWNNINPNKQLTQHRIMDSMTEQNRIKYHKHFHLKDIENYYTDSIISILEDEWDMDELAKYIPNIQKPTIGPYTTNKLFVNASQTEYALTADTLMEVTKECIRRQTFGIVYSGTNYPKLIDFEHQKAVIRSHGLFGYCGDILLRGGPSTTQSLQYYNKTKQSWRSAPSSHTSDADEISFWKIPKNERYPNVSDGYYCGDSLYALINPKMPKFQRLVFIDLESGKVISQKYDSFRNKLPCVGYNGRVFYIYDSCLYELEWIADSELPQSVSIKADNAKMYVKRTKHLPFLSCIDGGMGNKFESLNQSHSGDNPFGIIFTLTDDREKTAADSEFVFSENNYFLCYNPEKQIIYRFTKNDITFTELILENNAFYQDRVFIDGLVWNKETQSMIICINNHIMRVNKNCMFAMQYKNIDDLYNKEAAVYDSSFAEYKSNNTDFECYFFGKVRSGRGGYNQYRRGDTRAEFMYHCSKKPKCYNLIAGYNMEEQSHFTQLKALQSKDYRKLTKIEDIGDYIGAPIWYQTQSNAYGIHLIKTGSIIDLHKLLRSTKKLTGVICVDTEAGQETDLNKYKWFGIVGIGGDEEEMKKNALNYDLNVTYSVTSAPIGLPMQLRYDKLNSHCFQVTNGRILCANPRFQYWGDGAVEFGNALKGKWYWKMWREDKGEYNGPNRLHNNWHNAMSNQMIAYHESVRNDAECTDCWDLDSDIFERDEEEKDYLNMFYLENIREKEEKYAILKDILLNSDEIRHVTNGVLNEDIILEICEFCYFIETLNWIEKAVLNGEWYLHRRRIDPSYQRGQIGIFDLDNYWNEDAVQNPFVNEEGYDFFMFDYGQRRFLSCLWEETIYQSLREQNACSVPFGCVTKCQDLKNPVLAKMNDENKVVSIRVVCMELAK